VTGLVKPGESRCVADIFINYRTGDAPYEAAQLNQALSERYGADRVFFDLAMLPGTLGPEAIPAAVRAANVVLAVIGPRWATVTDKTGRRCLDDPEDWVRQELSIALRTGRTVIPVMLDGARFPSRDLLPADLRDIRKPQRFYLRRRSLHADHLLLVRQLEQVVPGLKPLPSVRTVRDEPADSGSSAYHFGSATASDGRAVSVSVEPLFPLPAAPETPWCGGDERRIGEHAYFLHDHPRQEMSADRLLVWREAVADRLDPQARVYLRQAWAIRPNVVGLAPARAGLREQARLLELVGGRLGLPRLLDLVDDDGHGTTVVSAAPAGPTWQEAYRPGEIVLDRIRAAAALGAVVGLCQGLAELHRLGASHRAVHPDGVVLMDRAARAVPRSAGLAGVPAAAGEGPAIYRAPEQASVPGLAGTPGPRTDVYQVAALVYHTLTSHPPGAGQLVPVRATHPGVPEAVDDVLRRCLSRDPADRVSDLGPLVSAVGDARRSLSGGDRG
jgi:hypothetical protein